MHWYFVLYIQVIICSVHVASLLIEKGYTSLSLFYHQCSTFHHKEAARQKITSWAFEPIIVVLCPKRCWISHLLRLALSAMNLNAPVHFPAVERRGPLTRFVSPCRITRATLRGSGFAFVCFSFLFSALSLFIRLFGLQDRAINIHKSRVSTFVSCVDSLTTRRSTAYMY